MSIDTVIGDLIPYRKHLVDLDALQREVEAAKEEQRSQALKSNDSTSQIAQLKEEARWLKLQAQDEAATAKTRILQAQETFHSTVTELDGKIKTLEGRLAVRTRCSGIIELFK
jgi:hypothetical protein